MTLNRIILFRVDCNQEIASGHLMRCISIAQEAENHDIEVLFLMSDSNSKNILAHYGFNYINLNSNWENINEEIPKLIDIAIEFNNPILFVDTYSINGNYTAILQNYYTIVYLGSKQQHFPGVKLLINYSTQIDFNFYNLYYSDTELCLGPLFTPLRQEFNQYTAIEQNNIERVLITTGNTDPNKITYNLLKKIATLKLDHINFEIIIGNLFDGIDQLLLLANENPNFHFHKNVSKMTSIYRKCQLAISANGTTVYELCACHIPAISIAISNEQVSNGIAMKQLGIVDYCGLFKSLEDISTLERVCTKLMGYINHPKQRRLLINKASKVIDTKGCNRIISAIIKSLT